MPQATDIRYNQGLLVLHIEAHNLDLISPRKAKFPTLDKNIVIIIIIIIIIANCIQDL